MGFTVLSLAADCLDYLACRGQRTECALMLLHSCTFDSSCPYDCELILVLVCSRMASFCSKACQLMYRLPAQNLASRMYSMHTCCTRTNDVAAYLRACLTPLIF